jgi:hypothetical protein
MRACSTGHAGMCAEAAIRIVLIFGMAGHSMADSSIADGCRRKAIEAEELAQKSNNPVTRKSYEDIAALWRKMADQAEISDDESW